MKKNTTKEVLPTKPGTRFAGGIYIGRFFDGVEAYALIVAPKAEGELAALPHADATKQAKALRIADHNDWRLPTRLEALMLWNERKSLKAGEQFADAWYWTSEQNADGPAGAWVQSFLSGGQYDGPRGYDFRARAVRRLKI